MNRKPLLIAAACIVFLAGCADTRHVVQIDREAAALRLDAAQKEIRAATEDSARLRLAAQDVQRPYIAGNSVPLAREIAMPDALRRKVPVTVLFQKAPVDLLTALRQVSEAVPEFIATATPDALLPASAFAPRVGPGSSAGPQVVASPSQIVMPQEPKVLWALLDDVARQGNLSWRPVPGGAEFYRVETKFFQLAASVLLPKTDMSLGRNGSGSIFESNSKTIMAMGEQNPMKGLLTTVEAMLSVGGRAVLNPEAATLVVTDTPANLSKISEVVHEQNKILSRRVRVLLEVVELVDKNASDIGVDWNLIYGSASRALSNTSPVSLTGFQASRFSVGPTAGPFAGSELVVRALNEVGTVVERRVFPFLTTSGKPVTRAIRTTFNYVDQVQATSQPAGSTIGITGTAPTVTQKEETVGTFVTMVPTAKSDDTIFLSMHFDLTSAQPLVPFTVGSADSQVTVQQKTIDGTGFVQEIPVRSGQTVIVGGFEATTNQDNIRRLAPSAPILLGGSNSTKLTKTRMLVLATAVAEEGV